MSRSNRLDPNDVDNKPARQGGGNQPPTFEADISISDANTKFLLPVAPTEPEPVRVENHADEWLPDRGMGEGVYHGVPPSVVTGPPDDKIEHAKQQATVNVSEPPSTEPKWADPVPVFIVNPASGKESMAVHRAFNVTVPPLTPIAILGQDFTRTRMWVRNDTIDTTNTNVADTTVTMAPSAARTTTGNSGTITSLSGSTDLRVQLDVTAASGTTPTLDVVIQDSIDGTTWNTVGTFAQKTTTGREVISISTPYNSRLLRVLWTIAGTTPSFTFSVVAIANTITVTLSPVDVRIGHDTSVSATYGWLLKPGEIKEIVTQAEVYAVSTDALLSGTVSILTESGLAEGI